MSDMEVRYKTTRFIWGVYFALMVALIISTSWSDGIGIFHFLTAGAMSVFTFITTDTVWGGSKTSKSSAQSAEESSTKRKSGDKLNQMLSRLSEDEVDALREKLLEESRYSMVDDGETVMKNLR